MQAEVDVAKAARSHAALHCSKGQWACRDDMYRMVYDMLWIEHTIEHMPQKDVSDDSDFNGASSPSSISTSDTFPQNVSHRRLSVRYFMFLSLSPSPSPLASASSCVCLVFVLNMDCVCLCVCWCLCVSICVCVSQFVVEIVLLISYECQRWRWRWRCWALLGTRFSFRWKQEWFAPSQKLVRCCDPPSPFSTPLWSPLDRIAVWLEKPQDFPSTIFQSLPCLWYLFVSLSQSCLGLGYTENNLNPQRVLGIKKFKAIKSSHRQPPLGSHSPNSGTDKQTASRN